MFSLPSNLIFVKALSYRRFSEIPVEQHSVIETMDYCAGNTTQKVVMILRDLETGQEFMLTFDNTAFSNGQCNVIIEKKTN